MKETYFGLGLMSGTSMDGVDASIISSNGKINMNQFMMNFLSMMKIHVKICILVGIKY
tara:strand:- start:557 stop:730 length:174 start_codon:yes stop_codon:yes gene_type:complete